MTLHGQLLADMAAALLPARCQSCGGASDDFLLCSDCIAELPWNTHACRACAVPLATTASTVCPVCLERAPRFDAAFAAFVLRGVIQRSVHRLKYRAGLAEAPLLAQLMASRLQERREPLPELLVPVPLHPRRLAWRGYNQALLLAEHLGALLDRPVAPLLVRRRRVTPDQIGKPAAERRRNVRGAFVLAGRLNQRHIALIDDVMTTGATLEAITRVCRRGGAQTIEAWVAARAC